MGVVKAAGGGEAEEHIPSAPQRRNVWHMLKR